MILRGLRHCQYNPGALDDLPPKNQHYQEDSEEADEYDDPGWIMDKSNHADDDYMDTDDQSNSVNDNLTSSFSDLENEETNPFKFIPVIDFAQFAIEKQYSADTRCRQKSCPILGDPTTPPNFMGHWVAKQRFHALTLGTSQVFSRPWT